MQKHFENLSKLPIISSLEKKRGARKLAES
jgi:hypothetical protein